MPEKQRRIIVIGAGVGGIGLAVYLRRKFPNFDNFVIYEKGDDLAGTWRTNSYPGCSSDVPSMFFSLSTDLNPNWDYTHAQQSQFLQYWKDVATKYNIYKNMKFKTMVTSAEWDASRSKWIVKTKPVKEDISKVRHVGVDHPVIEQTDVEDVDEAEILISALGILEVVNYPDILGLDSFKGPLFHSGAWDHSVDLKGKRVAVIGNAASATQIVPAISEDPLVKVTNFCRSPNWVLPPIRSKHNALQKWAFRNVPFFMKLQRFRYFLTTDIFYSLVFAHPAPRALMTMILKSYIRQTAPEKYHDKLIPDFVLGCKRALFDTDYLASMHRPNVELNWDGIECITENGIVTKKGETLPFDVLVFATGFIADEFPLHIKGTKETVREFYNRSGGPTAYMGTTLPGFPNMYMLGGPNTTTGHTSVIFTEECQIDYLLKLVEPVLDGQLESVVVTEEATNRYNDKIQRRMNRSVFVECVSWYRKGGVGKVTSIFPGPSSLFLWWFRKVTWGDYKVETKDEKAWKSTRTREGVRSTLKKVFRMLIVPTTLALLVNAKRTGALDGVVREAQLLASPFLTEARVLFQGALKPLTSCKQFFLELNLAPADNPP